MKKITLLIVILASFSIFGKDSTVLSDSLYAAIAKKHTKIDSSLNEKERINKVESIKKGNYTLPLVVKLDVSDGDNNTYSTAKPKKAKFNYKPAEFKCPLCNFNFTQDGLSIHDRCPDCGWDPDSDF